MLTIALTAAFVVLATVLAASAVVTRNAWRQQPWLAPAYGLLGFGIGANVAWVLCWIDRRVVRAFAVVLVLTAVAVLVRARVWTSWRLWLPLVLFCAGLLSVTSGHAFLWGSAQAPFETMAVRYRSLPADGYLQYLFAYDLWKDLSTVGFHHGWNGSDRPQLQSGVLLERRPWARIFGIGDNAPVEGLRAMQWGLAGSIVAQLTWVPGMYSLLRSLGFAPRLTLWTSAFVAVVPLSIYNIAYTWPKLLSAGFALAALAILTSALIARPPSVLGPTVIAVVLAVLSFLSHGAAAFVLPLFVLMGVLVLRGHGIPTWVRVSAASLAAAAATYLPWVLYERYADPSNSRLLKWHFPGVVEPNDEPFLHVLRQAYATTPVSTLWSNRKANLAQVFDVDVAQRLHHGTWPFMVREQDFFSPAFAIGLGTAVLLAFVTVALTRLLSRRATDRAIVVSLTLLGGGFVSMLLWARTRFLPGSAIVHAGSYVWLLLFAAVPFAWLMRWSWLVAVLVLLAQTGYTAVTYHAPSSGFPDPALSWPAIVGVVLGLLVLLVSVRASAPSGVPGPPPATGLCCAPVIEPRRTS